MSIESYTPKASIPKVALYLALRGRFGHKSCPKAVEESHSFARANPGLAARAEELIEELYGPDDSFLDELAARYSKLSKEGKQRVYWQTAAEVFIQGNRRRVLRLF